MSEFILNQPLSQNRIDERQRQLIDDIGLSSQCVDALRDGTRSLCSPTKVERRMHNLDEIGFDARTFVEINPTILHRKRATVTERVSTITDWFKGIDVNADVIELLLYRPQLWSVGRQKLMTIFLLSNYINTGVTPERICNMITINLEDILLTYINGCNFDFVQLRYKAARYNKKKKLSKFAKKRVIVLYRDKLPKDVYDFYEKSYIQ